MKQEKIIFYLLTFAFLIEYGTFTSMVDDTALDCDFNNVNVSDTSPDPSPTGCSWTVTASVTENVRYLGKGSEDSYAYFSAPQFGDPPAFLSSPPIYLTRPTHLFFEFYMEGPAYIQVSAIMSDSAEVELFSTRDIAPIPKGDGFNDRWLPARIPLCFSNWIVFRLKVNYTYLNTSVISFQPALGIDNIQLSGGIRVSSDQTHQRLAGHGMALYRTQQDDSCMQIGFPVYNETLTCTLPKPMGKFCGWELHTFFVNVTFEVHSSTGNWYLSAKPMDNPVILEAYLEVTSPIVTLERAERTIFSFWYSQKGTLRSVWTLEVQYHDGRPSRSIEEDLSDTTALDADIRWVPVTIAINQIFDENLNGVEVQMDFVVDFQWTNDPEALGHFMLDRTWFSAEPGFDVDASGYTAVCGGQSLPTEIPSVPSTNHPDSTPHQETSTSGTTQTTIESTMGSTETLTTRHSIEEQTPIAGVAPNDESLPEAAIIGLGAAGGAVLLMAIACVAFRFTRGKRRRAMQLTMKKLLSSSRDRGSTRQSLSNLYTIQLQDLSTADGVQSALAQYTKLLDVPRNTLEISDTVLGRGEFGLVVKGLAHKLPTVTKGPTVVAVKTIVQIADHRQQLQFAEEYKVMLKAGRHVNIVNILGIVNQDQRHLILEYCRYGSLLTYLRNRRNGAIYSHVDATGGLLQCDENAVRAQWIALCHREDRPVDSENMVDNMLTTNDLIKFSHQICRGMEYLASRSIIHRDLAARNVLVADNHVMKISDFGLAKHGGNSYTVSNVFVALPILWMPPDAILTREFSEKSDVWSFGVLLWEIFSIGQVPFDRPDVARFSASVFAEWLMEGHQMERPDGSPSVVYELMRKCWILEAVNRPTFSRLWEELDQLVSAAADQSSSNYLPLNDDNTATLEECHEDMPDPRNEALSENEC